MHPEDDTSTLERNELRDDLEILVDGYFKTKWENHAAAYLIRYGYIAVRSADQFERYTRASAALSSGTMGLDDYEELLLADSVLVAERQSDGSAVYLVCVVQARLRAVDIRSATLGASAATRIDGSPGVAIAAGASIDDIAAALAEREGVTVIIPQSWRKSA